MRFHSGFLCAISVFSVSLWLNSAAKESPQRHNDPKGVRAFLLAATEMETAVMRHKKSKLSNGTR